MYPIFILSKANSEIVCDCYPASPTYLMAKGKTIAEVVENMLYELASKSVSLDQDMLDSLLEIIQDHKNDDSKHWQLELYYDE